MLRPSQVTVRRGGALGTLGSRTGLVSSLTGNIMRIFVLATGVVVLLLIAAGAFMYPQISRLIWPYLDREIASKVTIGPKWLEITPARSLTADREIQEIILWVEAPVRPSANPLACLLPDGSLVTPEVELVGDDGKIYKLAAFGETVYPRIKDHFDATLRDLELPRGKTYRTVRIRCEQEIPVKKILWRCYNPWEV